MKKIFKLLIVIIIIVFLGYLVFNNRQVIGDKLNIKTDTTKIEKDKNLLVATNLKDSIFLIKEDGTKINLFDITNYKRGISYCFFDNKLYLYLNNEIGYIDLLSEKYEYVKLEELGDNYAKSIAVTENTIYYISSSNKIYKYNIDSKETEEINDDTFNNVNYIYSIGNDSLAYYTAATMSSKPEIGIINLGDNKKNIISENASIEYTYNNYLIYKVNAKDNTSWIYYKYDPKNNKSTQISDSTHSSENIYSSFIIPYDDYFIYANNSKLYSYDNKTKELYDLKSNIDSMNLTAKNKLNIFSYGDFSDAINIELNIDNLKDDKIDEDKKLYNVIYIN